MQNGLMTASSSEKIGKKSPPESGRERDINAL